MNTQNEMCRGFEPIRVSATLDHLSTTLITAFDKDRYITTGYGENLVNTGYLRDGFVFLPMPNAEIQYPYVEYLLVHSGRDFQPLHAELTGADSSGKVGRKM